MPGSCLLERATLAVGRLDSISTLLPDPHLFLYSYIRREAVLSSQIEGTQSSLSDLLLFELEEAPGTPLDDAVEVSNYIAALEHGLVQLREGFPLSNRLLREMHAALMAKGRGSEKQPGEFRSTGDWEAWIDFFLEGVEQTARNALQTARRLADLFGADTLRIQQTGRAAANALRVLAALRQRPVLTLKHLHDAHGITFPTASKAMQALTSAGIARELTGRRRNRVFVYDAYLAILNEEGQPL